MSNDLNRCEFIGRLGKDIELRFMPSGAAVANFSIAVGSKWNDKQSGEKKEKTEWVNIVAFNKLAEIMGQYLNKGSQIFVCGEMRTRKWQDSNGQDKYTTEIVANEMQMLGSKQQGGQQAARPAQQRPAAQQPAPAMVDDGFDDDIPF